MGFTEYNVGADVRYAMGWFYIAILVLLLTINVVVIAIDIVQGIINSCKQRKQQKRVEEEKKRRLEK